MKSAKISACGRSSKMALVAVLEHKLTELKHNLATAQKKYEKYSRLGNKELVAQYERAVARCTERIDAVRDTIKRQRQIIGK